jgi:uncharacterized lipoprotein NlpE involved in copper resistance
MRKSFFVSLTVLMLALVACNNEQQIITLSSLLTANSGTWKVSFAKFGDENAPSGMYDRFTIQFRNDGSYATVNPDGAIAFTNALTGRWVEGTTANTIVFDGRVTVREITTVRTANKLTFEWDVTIPGKVTTTYRLELSKAN